MANTFEKFGKYILLEKMASGGMAEVYLAKSMGANGVTKFLAIKRILPQFSDNEEFIDMFKEEAKIAVNLNHGNVVSIYDFGVEKSQFYLVMEYVEGRNLRQIINELKKKNISFSNEQIVFMIKEVAAGLDHAHRCIDGSTGKPLNITHRDMSPQNIMVSFEGEVKIIDFGIAKAETQLEATKAGTLKGKFGYMSPEQAEGLPIDLRTDVFSLGIVLWELLANDRLFTSNSEAAILRKIRECNIPPIRKINPAVHPELERILSKALAKDKTLRYQTSAALNRDLNRFINTQYPEFSPNDFSVFIKNAFAEIFSEQKGKLVEFSKVQATIIDDPSQILHSNSGLSESSIPGFPNSGTSSGISHSAEELGLNLPNEVPVDLKTLVRERPVELPTETMAGKTNIATGYIPSRPGMSGGSISGNTGTGVPQYSFNSSRKRKTKATQNSSNSIAMILTVVLVVGIGFVLFKNKTSSGGTDMGSKTPSLTFPNDGDVKTTPPDEDNTTKAGPDPFAQQPRPIRSARQDSVAVSIQSDPQEAQIYINGVDTGYKTPHRMTKTSNTEYQLRLVKPGYFPLEKTITLTRPVNTLNLNLVKERYGFVNLVIVGGGSKPIVEINGEIVDKPLPIKMHRIPAGMPVSIRVNNEFLNTSAAETITVNENQKKFVELVLKSNQ